MYTHENSKDWIDRKWKNDHPWIVQKVEQEKELCLWMDTGRNGIGNGMKEFDDGFWNARMEKISVTRYSNNSDTAS